MTEAQYERWTRPLRARPAVVRAILLANRILTYAGYIAYALLLVLTFVYDRPEFPQYIFAPAIGFALLTAARALINAPRPYEVLDIQPLINKPMHGKSFPSRHIFSMTMIAVCWCAWCPPAGIGCIIACVAMAIVRILGGIHFPRDVIAGALFAVVTGLIGLWIF